MHSNESHREAGSAKNAITSTPFLANPAAVRFLRYEIEKGLRVVYLFPSIYINIMLLRSVVESIYVEFCPIK